MYFWCWCPPPPFFTNIQPFLLYVLFYRFYLNTWLCVWPFDSQLRGFFMCYFKVVTWIPDYVLDHLNTSFDGRGRSQIPTSFDGRGKSHEIDCNKDQIFEMLKKLII